MKTAEEFIIEHYGQPQDDMEAEQLKEFSELMDKYAEAKAGQVDAVVNGTKWISVEDELPEEMKTVLLWVPKYKNMTTGFLQKDKIIKDSNIVLGDVTHWAELPEWPE